MRPAPLSFILISFYNHCNSQAFDKYWLDLNCSRYFFGPSIVSPINDSQKITFSSVNCIIDNKMHQRIWHVTYWRGMDTVNRRTVTKCCLLLHLHFFLICSNLHYYWRNLPLALGLKSVSMLSSPLFSVFISWCMFVDGFWVLRIFLFLRCF